MYFCVVKTKLKKMKTITQSPVGAYRIRPKHTRPYRIRPKYIRPNRIRPKCIRPKYIRPNQIHPTTA